jgi:hypothetical protein
MLLDTNFNENLIFATSPEVAEHDQLINEAILYQEGVTLTEEEALMLVDAGILSERTIVKMDKFANKNRDLKKAVLVIAREKNDPAFKKLVVVYKMKKKLIGILVKKYGSQAKARVMKNRSSMQKNTAVHKLVKNKVPASSLLKHKDIPAKVR